MRVDPDQLKAARARLLAMSTGTMEPTGSVPRRTAHRRNTVSEKTRMALAELPAETMRIAADPQLLSRMVTLAAAIELGNDIAAVIDRNGRAALDDVLGADLRRMAVAARNLAGPRRWIKTTDIVSAHEIEAELARDAWTSAFPRDVRLADGLTPALRPSLDPRRQERLATILTYAETAVTQPPTTDEIAA